MLRPPRMRYFTDVGYLSGDIEFLHKPSNTGRFNKLVGRFTDPAQGFSTHDYLPVTYDDGLGEQVGNTSFLAENDGMRVQRLAMLNLMLSRNSAPLTFPIKGLNIDVNVDEFVTLSMPSLGFNDAVFYVDKRTDVSEAKALLTLLPWAEEDYEWSYEDATEITTVTPVAVFKTREELT